MKKHTLIILSLFVFGLTAQAQKVQPAAAAQKESFLGNPQVRKLIDNFKAKGFTPTGYVAEGTQTYTGKDASGDVNLSLITYHLVDKSKNAIDVAVFTDNRSKDSTVWAENPKEVFKVTGNEIRSSPQKTSPTTNATAKSAGDCLKQFIKSGGPQSCGSCVSCVNGCWSKNAKWKRIACAVGNCSGSCWSCVKSVYGFVVCIFD
jgi:hypothetical protein